MSTPRQLSRPPFVSLPRHRRGDAVIRLKGEMRRAAGEYGGRFLSDVLMRDPDQADRDMHWLDFYFPGSDRFTLWNAEIVTASLAFSDAVRNAAYARAWDAMSDADQERESTRSLEPADRSRTGKVLSYPWVQREPVRYAQFDGRTFSEQVDLLEASIPDNEPPAIHASFRIDRSFVHGIGLYIVVDEPRIDQATVEAAIDRFLALGETDWVSPEPVARERLGPTDSLLG